MCQADGEVDTEMDDSDLPNGVHTEQDKPSNSNGQISIFEERAKYIPMRLSLSERRLLRLLEAALSVSEYTDKVSWWVM